MSRAVARSAEGAPQLNESTEGETTEEEMTG